MKFTISPRLKRSLIAILSPLWLAACAIHPTGALPSVPAPPPISGEHYSLRVGDLLTITFSGEADLTQQARVDWNGMVNLPALAADGKAEIKALGLSPSELAVRINSIAKDNHMLVNARAQVLVSEYASQAFSVLGQVAQPGRYSFPRGLPPQLNIEEAIALAGGCTRLARQSHLLVKRGASVYAVNLEALASQPGHAAVVIIPGDVITVEERLF